MSILVSFTFREGRRLGAGHAQGGGGGRGKESGGKQQRLMLKRP